MYRSLARAVAARPLITMLIWLIIVGFSATAALTGFGDSLFNRLNSDVPQATNSESWSGQQLLEKSKAADYAVVAMVEGIDLVKERDEAIKNAEKLKELTDLAKQKGEEAKAKGEEAKEAADPALYLKNKAEKIAQGAREFGSKAGNLANQAQSLGQEAQNLGERAKELGVQAGAKGAKAMELKTQAQNLGAQAKDLQNQAQAAGEQARAIGAQAQQIGQQAKEQAALAQQKAAQAQSAADKGDFQGAKAAQEAAQAAGAQAQNLGAQAKDLQNQAQSLGAQAQEKGQLAAQYGQQAQQLGAQAAQLGAQARSLEQEARQNGQTAKAKGDQAKRLGNEAKDLGNRAKQMGNEAMQVGQEAKNKGDIAQKIADQAQALGKEAQKAGDEAKKLAEPNWPVAKALNKALKPLEKDIKNIERVKSVNYPFVEYNAMLDHRAMNMVADDAKGFVMVVTMDLDDGEGKLDDRWVDSLTKVENTLLNLGSRLKDMDATVRVTDNRLVSDAGLNTLKNDLIVSESIGIPLSFMIMILVFGGVLAAILPLAGAGVAIFTSLAIMFGMTYIAEQQSFSVNVISVMGLGLSIDYGLLIVSRFREEMRRLRRLPLEEQKPKLSNVKREKTRLKLESYDPCHLKALEITMGTAGRTVMFSALTVAISACGMLFFRPSLLKSLGIAGVSVILLAVITAMTLIPAFIIKLAGRLEKPSVLASLPGMGWMLYFSGQKERYDDSQKDAEKGENQPNENPQANTQGRRLRTSEKNKKPRSLFMRFAHSVNRHPWPFFIVSAIVLAMAAMPLGDLHLRNSLLEMMPLKDPQRILLEDLQERVPVASMPQMQVIAKNTKPEQLDEWMEKNVSTISGVKHVYEANTLGEKDAVSAVKLDTTDAGSKQAEEVVLQIRSIDAPFVNYVIGQAANQLDFMESLAEGLPWALVVIICATFLLLFFMTGSVVVPLQALLINLFSLLSTLGLSTLIFVDGWGVGLIGASPLPGLESYVVVMLVCFGFGLSMDYEVFLLSRIKEVWDETGDNAYAVEQGMRRSARIITSAATVLVFVFLAFVTGKMIVLKEVGMVLAISVAMDATIVRMVLVPSVMTILGRANWWAPKPLERLQRKVALRLGYVED